MRTRAPIVLTVTLFFLSGVLLFLLVLTPAGVEDDYSVPSATDRIARKSVPAPPPSQSSNDSGGTGEVPLPEKRTFLYDGRVGDYGRELTEMPVDIDILDLEGRVVKTVTTDGDGRFKVRLPESDYVAQTVKRIRSYHGGGSSTIGKDGKAVDTDIGLFKLSSVDTDKKLASGIEGVVIDAVSGEPVVGTLIIVTPTLIHNYGISVGEWFSLFGRSEVEDAVDGQTFNESFEFTTMDDGRYRLSVPPGRYNLITDAARYFDISTTFGKRVLIRPGRYYQLNLVLIPKATVSGYVTDTATGAPVEGAEITIGKEREKTDRRGFYSIKSTLGAKAIECKAPYYKPLNDAPKEIVVSREDIRLDFKMRPEGYMIRGRIYSNENEIHPWTKIRYFTGKARDAVDVGPGRPCLQRVRGRRGQVYKEGGFAISSEKGGGYVIADSPGYFPVASEWIEPTEGLPGYCELHLKPNTLVKVSGKLYDPDTSGAVLDEEGKKYLRMGFLECYPLIRLDSADSPVEKWHFGECRRFEFNKDQAYSIELPPGLWLFCVNTAGRKPTSVTSYREIIDISPGSPLTTDFPLTVFKGGFRSIRVFYECEKDPEAVYSTRLYAYYRGCIVNAFPRHRRERYNREIGDRVVVPAEEIVLIAETSDGLYRSDPVMVNVTEDVDSDNPPEVTLVLKPVK